MKNLFINIDTQKDFMNNNGSLYIDGAETIKDNLKKLTQIAYDNKITVINTADWHDDNCDEFSDHPDFKSTFPPHCIKNTEGSEFIEETKPIHPLIIDWDRETTVDEDMRLKQVHDIVIRKNAFNVFDGNQNTESIIKILNPETVFIYGVAADVCVNQAAVTLNDKFKNITVFIIFDAIKYLPNSKSLTSKWFDQGILLTMVEKMGQYI